MLDFSSLTRQAFGLDISDRSLKIAKLEKKGKYIKLVSFEEHDIPEGILSHGEIKKEEELAAVLADSLKKVELILSFLSVLLSRCTKNNKVESLLSIMGEVQL